MAAINMSKIMSEEGLSERAVSEAMRELAAERRSARLGKLPLKELKRLAICRVKEQIKGERRAVAIMDIMSANGWRPFG
jgi:hypothetical protein